MPTPYLVLAAPGMLSVQENMIQKNPEMFEVCDICMESFPDGTPNIIIQNVQELRFRNVIFLTSFTNMADVLSQIAVIYAVPRYLAKSFTVVLPFFPTGTMERVDVEGQVATAATLTRMLSATPITSSGPTRFVIFDIHALQERFYFHDNVVPCLLSAIPALLRILKQKYKQEELAIVFPDDGAKKRFAHFFKGWEMVVFTKMREGNKRVLKVTEGDPSGKHCVIVDDMVQSGGTMLQCKDELKARNAAKISCYVTHGVFPNQSWKKFVDAGIDTFFLTDSIPQTTAAVKDVKPFEIVPLAGEIVEYFKECVW
eukprot:TRINITY_DN68188_c9_g2_i2.p1 TRINITY_DN68188_c9_g2~~TRINITY_DN68188_c9_g2_i2.p1  ORF type:complete len:313 (-),score=23.69 TRINITY_DN68188_c9_g2_i2:1758-2696(-)